jgi:hypothetical protein
MNHTTTAEELYTTGTYLEKNPAWHTEESPWKAEQVMRMLNRHKITPKTICEVGCGVSEVLKQLEKRLANECDLLGCDISPSSRLGRHFSCACWAGKTNFTLID